MWQPTPHINQPKAAKFAKFGDDSCQPFHRLLLMVGCVNYRHMYKKNSQECEADKIMVSHGMIIGSVMETVMVSVMALVMGSVMKSFRDKG